MYALAAMISRLNLVASCDFPKCCAAVADEVFDELFVVEAPEDVHNARCSTKKITCRRCNGPPTSFAFTVECRPLETKRRRLLHRSLTMSSPIRAISSVVAMAVEESGYDGPFVTESSMGSDDGFAFFENEGLVFGFRGS